MDEKLKLDERSSSGVSKSLRPYVKPEVRLLGDVLELTRGAAGSVSDGARGAQSSTITTKKDVAYLDERDRDAVMRELLGLRLARWEYKDGRLNGHRPLGIIIEDAPDVAAVTPDKQTVDLYSYASMAIAAVQVQAREIETLRAEVQQLRIELARLKD